MPPTLANAEPAFFSKQVRRANRFYLNFKARPQRALAVVCGGYEDCAADYAIRRDQFPYLTLEYVLAGKGCVQLGERTAALAAGVVFTYGPGTPHEILADPADPPRKYFINFAGLRAAALLRSCGLPPGSCCAVTSGSRVQQLFDDLIEHGAAAAGVRPSCVMPCSNTLCCGFPPPRPWGMSTAHGPTRPISAAATTSSGTRPGCKPCGKLPGRLAWTGPICVVFSGVSITNRPTTRSSAAK